LVQAAELGVAFDVSTSFILFLFSFALASTCFASASAGRWRKQGVASFHRRGLSKTLSTGLAM
jgi:hypothetical protein